VLPPVKVLVLSGVILLITLVSSFFSGAINHSLFGFGLEQDTFISLFVYFLLMILITNLWADKRSFFSYYSSIFVVAVIVFISQLLVLFHVFFPTFFSNGASNLIGKWNSFGIFYGFIITAILVALEFFSVKEFKLLKSFLYVVLVISLITVSFVNFDLVWWVVGVMSLLVYAYAVTFRNFEQKVLDEEGAVPIAVDSGKRKIIRPSLIVLIVAVLFITLGGAPNANNTSGGILWRSVTKLNNSVGVNSLEVRPSVSGTYAVFAKTFSKQNALLGIGPNNFSVAWNRYKPQGVNETNFWDVDFNFGVGLVPSLAVTTGILGLLSWILFLALLIYLGVRAISFYRRDGVYLPLVAMSFLGAVYFWIFAVFYVPDTTIFAFAFVLTGMFLGILIEGRREASLVIDFSLGSSKAVVANSLVVVALVVIVLGGGFMAGKLWSMVVYRDALTSLNTKGDVATARKLIKRALVIDGQDLYYRSLVDLDFIDMQSVLKQTGGSQDALIKQFYTALSQATTSSDRAIKANPLNYLNYVYAAKVYGSAAELKIQGGYEQALVAYNSALVINPTNPTIYEGLAKLEMVKGNKAKVREYANKALQVKMNYSPVITLLSQLDVADGNIQSAIDRLQSLINSNPNDPYIFFQLGLLKYDNGDYAGAAGALEQSVRLIPDYANAKYFLGLSYDKLGKKDLAINLFTSIAQTNPGNAEVENILTNLRAGRAALSSTKAADAKKK
ncbi:MAG: tetratricopeptide repeat protein, partial [bacterium]